MKIVPFSEKYRKDFIEFNTAWIIEYFGFLEEGDHKTFDLIDEELKAGAMIFFAIDEEENPLACCMVRPLNDQRWEICKFASNTRLNHKGAGSLVFEACIDYAKKKEC